MSGNDANIRAADTEELKIAKLFGDGSAHGALFYGKETIFSISGLATEHGCTV